MNPISACLRYTLRISISVLIFSTAIADTVDGVLEAYSGSADLPDSIAFATFLDYVVAGRRDGTSVDLRIVADALELNLEDPDEADQARSRSALFAEAHEALERERVVSSHAALCSGDEASKEAELIVDAMNAVDEIVQIAEEKQFLITLNSLSAEERTAFLAYLADLKLSISYTRINSRNQYEDRQGNLRADILRADLQRTCMKLESAKSSMGVQ